MIKSLTKTVLKAVSPAKRRMIIRYLLSIENAPSKPNISFQARHIEKCKLLTDRGELLKLLQKNSNKIAELGVFNGDFSEQIYEICKPEDLVLIDIWPEYNQLQYVKQRFNNLEEIDIIKGDAAVELEKFPDNYFDWIYIDTNHLYQETLDELLVAQKKITDNGFICGHDYSKGNLSICKEFGVIEAVHQFCVEQNFYLKYLTMEVNGYRSYALQKI